MKGRRVGFALLVCWSSCWITFWGTVTGNYSAYAYTQAHAYAYSQVHMQAHTYAYTQVHTYASTPSLPQAPRNPEYEQILLESLQAFYETEWQQTETLLQTAIDINSKDPRPYFFRSMIPFWEYFFVTQTPELAQQFLEQSEIAVSKSEQQLEINPSDTTSVLLLSALHGYRSLVAAGEREYRIAVRSGMTGFQFTRTLMSMDSNRPEVLIGRGMFYYMIGSVTKEARWLVNTLGVSADVEMGFEQLRKAANSDEQVSTEAMMMLMYLYDKEERFEEASEVAATLVERHPGNKIFHFKRGEILESLGRVDASAASFRQVLGASSDSLQELNRKAQQKLQGFEP